MHQHVNMGRRDTTLALPQDTATARTAEGAPDYRELHLQDGTSIFIPITEDSIPTD